MGLFVAAFLGTALVLSPSALARSGFGGHESNLLQPVATVISADGNNVTVLVRGQVTSMGNASTIHWQMFYAPVETGIPVYLNATGGSTVTFAQTINRSADLVPERVYVLGWKAWFEPWEDNTVDGEGLVYTVPALADVGVTPSHPFAPGILALGLPVDITLAFLGLIWLLLVLAAVYWYKMDSDTSASIIVLVLSFNIFMRFWPAFLLILLAFLMGFLIVRELSFSREEEG